MLPRDWFLALLTELAQCSQPENEQTWGMSDALLTLRDAAHHAGDLQNISVAAALAWVHRHMAQMQTTLLLAQGDPPERARLAYHEGRVMACQLILVRLHTLEGQSLGDIPKLGIACEGASMTK